MNKSKNKAKSSSQVAGSSKGKPSSQVAGSSKAKPKSSVSPTAVDKEVPFLPPLTNNRDILEGRVTVPSELANADFDYLFKVEEFNIFLHEIKMLPNQPRETMRLKQIQGCLQVIAKYIGVADIQNILAKDPLMCSKLTTYMTRSVIQLLYPIKEELEEGLNPDLFNEEKVRDRIAACFGALTNFFGATYKVPDVGIFAELLQFLHPFWFNRAYDAFESLPFGTLVNFTRSAENCSYYTKSGFLKVNELVARSAQFPSSSHQLPGIMDVLQNLSQVHDARLNFFDRGSSTLEKILLRLKPNYSDRVRTAVAGTLKNLSFEESYHHILVDEQSDILAYAIRPIVGKGEYDEEEFDGMPPLLYADLLENSDMARDPNPKVRRLVLDFLYRLCSLRDIRESLRKQNVYCLLREYHKWERDEVIAEYIERVVNLLVQTEDEIGAENLGAVAMQPN